NRMNNTSSTKQTTSLDGGFNSEVKIAVIGLGYVGLPLARLFATKYPVVGFDINRSRVEALQKGQDNTKEVADEVLKKVLLKSNPLSPISKCISEDGEKIVVTTGLFCSSDIMDIQECNY